MMVTLRSILARPQHPSWVAHPRTMDVVAKISVSLPDRLLHDVEDASGGNVNEFVQAALRNELDRLHLDSLMEQLEDGDGTVDEAEVARFIAMLASVDKANKEAKAREGGKS